MLVSPLRLSVLAVVLFVWFLSPPTASHADDGILKDVRDEFWIDGPDSVQPGVDRSTPAIAVDSTGRSIVAWTAFADSAGDRNDVFVRRFDGDDSSLDDPLMVNTTFLGEQDHPDVAVRDDGAFFVVWQSVEYDADDATDQRWVRGQLFDANGDPDGSERLLSQVSSGVFAYDLEASVVALKDGTFVVVWESRKGMESDSQDCSRGAVGCGSYSIQARRVGANGVPVGNQFQINQDPDRDQEDPALAPTAEGGFFVVWRSDNSIGTDTGYAIQGRRFNANGSGAGNELQINTSTDGTQWQPDVASNGLGDLLVVFESPNEYLVNNHTTLRARWLNSQGVPQGNDFFLSTIHPQEDHFDPRVAGGVDFFMVVWRTGVQGIGSDGSDSAVNGRIVLGRNQFEGGQFQVNDYEPGHQVLANLGGNHFDLVVAWHAYPQHGFEVDDGIVGRGYRFCSFFCDDFESGDTECWDNTVTR